MDISFSVERRRASVQRRTRSKAAGWLGHIKTLQALGLTFRGH
jgi:hypothetical protein